ncbi:MAG: hypothetical protein GY866_13430 [Proteobacteria bacterium]|nr:hypothetical protein [Pseudomonadota bacterium]
MLDLQKLKKQFNETGVVLAYSGFLSHNILTNIVQAVENNMLDTRFYDRPAQDVFTVLIEMIQNIINYHADKQEQSTEQTMCEGIIVLGFDSEKNKLFLKSGNTIQSNEIQRIAERIDSINRLPKEDLRSKYRELRKTRKQKSSRGAGLGFLEIQRRASEPIRYSFSEPDDDTLLYVLEVYI